MKNKNIASILFCLLTLPFAGIAQDNNLSQVRQKFERYSQRAVKEKIYLHMDRPFYLVGETMWFKAYYLDGASNTFTDLSKVAYLEVLDKENNAVFQTKFSLLKGKGDGSLVIPASVASGNYKVRCYTNWMKNFSADYYFETSVSIVNPFVRFDANPDEKKEISYDLQFFPEGGYLVRNLESKVGFRAVDRSGKGIDFSGAIINQANDTLVRFRPGKFGIGHFMFTPLAGNEYKVAINAEGKQYAYNLPAIQEQGYVMQVKDSTATQIKVSVTSKSDTDPVYLLVHTRQTNLYAEVKSFSNGKAVFLINKEKLGEGISHITILNDKQKAVCERLYFKKPGKQLAIQAKVGKKEFSTREKVTMDLSAELGTGAGELANMSVSVYLTDSIRAEDPQDIASWLWLTSDLKGQVEMPGYYFRNESTETSQELDNLMLTHGWRRFKWDDVFENKFTVQHLPEFDGHFIYGKVISTVSGEPAPNMETYLAAPDFPARLFVSKSNKEGVIRFEVKDFFGPKEVTVQTNLSKDSTYRFEMANPFSKQFSATGISSFSFNKALEKPLLTRTINMQTSNAFLPKAFAEPNVTIKDSLPFFGKPDEKYFLDDFTRFPTMEEVLREYVRGVLVRRRQKEFHFRMIDKLIPQMFYTTDPLVLMDGIPLFNIDKIMQFDPLKIKKIELMNGRYFLGPLDFTGVVSFTTYRNDLSGYELDPRVLVMSYEGVQGEREFYSPRYDNKAAMDSRVPDFRNLLHWAPDVTPDANGHTQLEFFTSDQPGHYRVVVQGITSKGRAGSQTFTFDVGQRNF